MEAYRFVYQDNMYWGSCEPCTASVFSNLVRSAIVNWKIGMRRAVREAVAKGQSLDDIVNYIAEAVAARAADGNNFGTVIIPEGVIEFIPAIKKLIAQLNDVLALPEAKEISRDE